MLGNKWEINKLPILSKTGTFYSFLFFDRFIHFFLNLHEIHLHEQMKTEKESKKQF